MRPRSFPSLLAALLSAGFAGWLAGAVIGVEPAVAHGAPLAAVVNVDAGPVADLDTTVLVDGRRGGDTAEQTSASTPDAAASIDAPAATGTQPPVEAAAGPAAVVTMLSDPAATPAPASSHPTPPPTQAVPAQPSTHAPTARPTPPPPTPVPTLPPTSAPPPPSDTQPPSSTPYSRQQIVDMIRSAAAAHGVNGDCMVSLAQRESGLYPNAYNPSGPYDGLFQFWPPTYRAHGGTDIWDPSQQSDVAAAMMAQGDGPGAWGITC